MATHPWILRTRRIFRDEIRTENEIRVMINDGGRVANAAPFVLCTLFNLVQITTTATTLPSYVPILMTVMARLGSPTREMIMEREGAQGQGSTGGAWAGVSRGGGRYGSWIATEE